MVNEILIKDYVRVFKVYDNVMMVDNILEKDLSIMVLDYVNNIVNFVNLLQVVDNDEQENENVLMVNVVKVVIILKDEDVAEDNVVKSILKNEINLLGYFIIINSLMD